MAEKRRENFYRNSRLIVDHAKESVVYVFELHLKNKHLSFEEFLNQNQHQIYHLCFHSEKCCKCSDNKLSSHRILHQAQLAVLFDRTGPADQCHIDGPNKRDLCCRKAKTGIKTDVLDITVARCLLINFCLDVFWYCCLEFQPCSFEDFLNENKHNIYHLWQINVKCCECSNDYSFPAEKPILKRTQWIKLFNQLLMPCEEHRNLKEAPAVPNICSVAAVADADKNWLSDAEQEAIIRCCCPIKQAVDELVDMRNKVFGHATEASMSNTDFHQYKNKIEEEIMKIAKVCKREPETKLQLEELQKEQMASDVMDKYRLTILEQIVREKDLEEGLRSISRDLSKVVKATETIANMYTQTSSASNAYCVATGTLTNERRIVIIGKAGAGKSTLGNTILGTDEFLAECSPAAVTTETKVGLGERSTKKLVVVDTPGLYDPTQSNEDVLREIMKCYALTSPGLHAILFVIEIGKFTPEEKGTVDLFLEKFGENVRNYMVVVFTGKEKLGKVPIEDFIKKFPSDSGMEKLLQQIQFRYLCIGKDKDKDDVDKLFKIIEDMVQRNGGGYYTNAMYEQTEKFLQERQLQEEQHEETVQMYKNQIESHTALIEQLLRKQEADKKEMNRLLQENEEIRQKMTAELEHKNSRNEQRKDITSDDFISSVLGVLFNRIINSDSKSPDTSPSS